MKELYSELQWLPRVPADFSRRLDQLKHAQEPLGEALRALASYSLDLNQLTRLSRVFGEARSDGKLLVPLTPYRLAVLSNSTMDLMVPAMVGSALRHGLALEVTYPAYGQVAQEAFNPDSKVNSSKPDAVLLALDYRALPLKLTFVDLDAAQSTVEEVIAYLQALRDGIRSHSKAICIFQTFAPPVENLFGNIDRSLPGTLRSLLQHINRELTRRVLGPGDILLDIDNLASTVGLADWHDVRLWNLAKLPFSDQFIPLYADHVARILGSVRGKSRKALILDLDNTVWGGTIGDDGLEGISIAQGDARGEAYLAVQRFALDLRQRGILLAVSSKNTDEVAREPFEKHSEMLLKLEHIAVFQANWNDKASNIVAIAEKLSLGLEAMVFLDDNPAERALVRTLLPQVAVPELSEDPAYYVRVLAAAGYFEAVSVASEDLSRAMFYRSNAQRATLREQVGGVDAYLASLQMVITFQPFNAAGRARIVQLINKSNQFNLTTRRYVDPEITEATLDDGVFTLQVRLTDIFGDNGMISVVIARPGGSGTWDIDTWVMSCRVLGRGVETMVLRELVRHAEACGISTILGTYRPTERNKMVAEHYKTLGFELLSDEDGVTRWQIHTSGVELQTAPMSVVSEGFKPLREQPSE